MSAPESNRRWRAPNMTALIVLLSAVAATIAVVAVAAAVSLWVRLDHQTSRVNGVVTQIQAERRRNVLNSCLDQNGRHDATIARLGDLPPGARHLTISLVDAVAPHRDCRAVVAQQVRGGKP